MKDLGCGLVIEARTGNPLQVRILAPTKEARKRPRKPAYRESLPEGLTGPPPAAWSPCAVHRASPRLWGLEGDPPPRGQWAGPQPVEEGGGQGTEQPRGPVATQVPTGWGYGLPHILYF